MTQVRLKSSDNEVIFADHRVIDAFGTFSAMTDALGGILIIDEAPIKRNAKSAVLQKIVDWCQRHGGETSIADNTMKPQNDYSYGEMTEWDESFLEAESLNTLFYISKECDALGVTNLRQIIFTYIADKLDGMDEDEICDARLLL